MCGVVAIWAPKGGVETAELDAAARALDHRGPDGKGVWVSPRHNVGLAHARLSIIDLTTGAQPIANEDETIHIVVNGELYDFERIREDLRRRGHRFRTNSDSEIAIHLYEEYGVGFLDYLRGEFAIVLWDERKQLLLAARDRFGVKPLVYSVQNGKLFVASEAKAIFAAGVRAAWDAESFFHAANMQYTLPHRTLFAGILQLQPGHYLIAHEGKIETQCYWDLDYACDSDLSATVDERMAIEQFRHQLSEAVRLRMRADIPVCFHLSGGLDSSAVVGLAAEHASGPLDCFSVSFEEESYDEFEIASEMARHVGARFHPIRITQKDLIANLSDAVYYSEGLAVNGHLPAKYLLNREIRRGGFKVALTGEGSDEAVAGYPHLRSDLFRNTGRDDLLPALHNSNKASQGIMLQHGRSLPLTAVESRLQYVPSFLEAKGTLGYKLCSVLDTNFKSRFSGIDCYEELVDCFPVETQMRGRNHVHQSLYMWSKTALANYILRTLGDGCEMAQSVEGRLPFLDHQLFQFVRNLPLSLKIKGTVEKFILRESVKDCVTDTIYRRQKHPFVAPPFSRYLNGAQENIQDTLRSEAFASVPFFDRDKVIALLDSLEDLKPDERAATDPVLMMALSASALHERFKLQEQP
ncbi:MAG TPA: asparagine synthase (glutamine-hydrolyzing) [Planktothrix sp.]|jgi:asparagine synthase (glutamine-hydrolysing)